MFPSRFLPMLAGLLFLALGGPAVSPAQSANVTPPARPEFGGVDRVLYAIGFSEFTPLDSAQRYIDSSPPMAGRYSTVPFGGFTAAPHLPSGVLLTYLELDYCDTPSTGSVVLRLADCDFLLTSCTIIGTLDSATGTTGCSFVSMDMTPLGYSTNNNSRRLLIDAVTTSGTPNTTIVGAYIGYKLQVSPAPASATFLDVPTGHPFFRFVEALVDAGVTAGCGGNNYCVNNPITRGEMAVFLSVALGLHFPN